MNRQQSKQQRMSGFTAIELVVSLAIIILVSAQIFVSFSGIGQGVTINRTVQEIIDEIRKAQYAAIAVIYAPNFGLPPSPSVGMRISTVVGPTPQVLRFIDRNDCAGCVQNNTYDAAQNEKIGEYALPANMKINRLLDDQGNTYSTMHILFQVPEATVFLAKDDGTAFPGNRVDIELASTSGVKKIITVRVTGQINAN
ncbi:MAG: type II secretion system protein [Candidatus Sungbacteria bacterium]|nr:type II secretion system protein [Candidatus Sungbacteria bacterium]